MQSQIYLPNSVADYFQSEEFKLRLYRTFKGKEPTHQWMVDRVYNTIKFPLYFHLKYILYMSFTYKNKYIGISSITLKNMFGNKYSVIKQITQDYFNGETFKSKEGVESYLAHEKIGFCKKYKFHPNQTLRIEPKRAIKIPQLERKRIMEILHKSHSPEIIEAINGQMELVQVKESATEETKKKVEAYQQRGLESKKTDARWYGLNQLKAEERDQLQAPNQQGELEDMVEVDYNSFHPRILAKLVYELPEERSKQNKFEECKWKAITEMYGDIYTFLASKIYKKQAHQVTEKQRKICKNTFLSILNTNYRSSYSINDSFRLHVYRTIQAELPLYADVLLQIDNVPDIHKYLQKWKYEKYKDNGSLTYRVLSTIESNIMISVLEKVMDRWDKMGFLWVHDGVYVPKSHANEVREIMNQEFENYSA